MLVTGGNHGLGLVIARTLAADGDTVAVTYLSGRLPKGVLGVPAYLGDPGSVDKVFDTVEEEQGPVEVLVVNACTIHDTLMRSMPTWFYERTLTENLNRARWMMGRVIPGMVHRGGGRIIMVASAATLDGEAEWEAGTGHLELTRAVAAEVAPYGITCNLVRPDLPPSGQGRVERTGERYGWMADEVPASAGEAAVAATVALLASPSSGGITGTAVPVVGASGIEATGVVASSAGRAGTRA
ncbi:SDR family NAD(P)-dependent oxidoreductase [Streptomyces sp. SAJ15]|uniref:SDR family NAD(P)-dependent oxidoreductase n=1 Tax=Streptomyces sp. SAJ15 TaxID=2011095 RepID=UPI0016428853|nr:SDR family NAD(P)-dependent oxidoreductase [Streptomyces sp. SAJ15]